jgi:hypothetical protein
VLGNRCLQKFQINGGPSTDYNNCNCEEVACLEIVPSRWWLSSDCDWCPISNPRTHICCFLWRLLILPLHLMLKIEIPVLDSIGGTPLLHCVVARDTWLFVWELFEVA